MLKLFKQVITCLCIALSACNDNHNERVSSLIHQEFGYSLHPLKIIEVNKSTYSIDSYYQVDFTVDSIEFITLLSIITKQNMLKHLNDSVWYYENTIGETSKVYISFYKTNHLISYNKIDE
jgi:hypothetical protein